MKYNDIERDLITLSSTQLGYKEKCVLLDGLKKECVDFEKYGKNLIKSRSSGVYNKVYTQFFDEGYRNNLFHSLDEKGITCVTYFSKDYPELLKKIASPPLVLYCRGRIELLNSDCFAVVGSRKTPSNILAECKRTASELAEKFTIVSGIADGADSYAIEGALQGGTAIVVLAYGHNFVYPTSSERLLKKVEEQGLVISEYPPDTEPRSFYFPVRNRIIAGLAQGVLVVSAAKKSGALITANYAVEYGRNVFAYPYSLGVSSGVGCNELIKKGCTLACDSLDIFTVFGLNFNKREQIPLTKEESEILEILSESGEAFAPHIAEKLNKQPFEIIPQLSSLEIKGKIIRLGGNRYSILNR